MNPRIVRPVRAHEWQRVREFRLAALRDPIAHIAFGETHEEAVARPDEFWQDRVAAAAEGKTTRQYIAEDVGGQWLGAVSVFVERPGDPNIAGVIANIVGVFVRPEARGQGLAGELIRVAVTWSLKLPGVVRVRLFVHQDNARAEAAYVRAGFRRTGASVRCRDDPGSREYELAYVGWCDSFFGK